jgi:hypothetical protein
MSCGTKLTPRWNSWHEREELAYKLEQEGEYRLASLVKHEECLDWGDLQRAEQALDRQGQYKDFDYREEQCRCRTEEEEQF